MIDNCDENIVAMYHITADDRVMSGINKAKKLTQTVQNSTYTTDNGDEKPRIVVSTLCPNSDKAFDTDSYAYKLAALSGGIAVTGVDMVEETEMQIATVETVGYLSSGRKNSTSGTVTKSLKQVLGEGNEGVYNVISSAGWTTIKLNKPLTEGSDEDYDKDGLSDWDEVNTTLIYNMYVKHNHSYTPIIKASYLPTLADCNEYYKNSENQKFYVESGYDLFEQYMRDKLLKDGVAEENIDKEIDKTRILPINSNPTEPDSDGDGFYDGITGKYRPIGYYQVEDKWPLTSKPKDNVIQKDGELYFDKLTVAETQVGGRTYAEHSGSLPIDIQKLVYNMCSDLNVDPNMIFAIALHESGFEADAGLENKDYNGSSSASGYMQLLDDTWKYYSTASGAYYDRYIDILLLRQLNNLNQSSLYLSKAG